MLSINWNSRTKIQKAAIVLPGIAALATAIALSVLFATGHSTFLLRVTLGSAGSASSAFFILNLFLCKNRSKSKEEKSASPQKPVEGCKDTTDSSKQNALNSLGIDKKPDTQSEPLTVLTDFYSQLFQDDPDISLLLASLNSLKIEKLSPQEQAEVFQLNENLRPLLERGEQLSDYCELVKTAEDPKFVLQWLQAISKDLPTKNSYPNISSQIERIFSKFYEALKSNITMHVIIQKEKIFIECSKTWTHLYNFTINLKEIALIEEEIVVIGDPENDKEVAKDYIEKLSLISLANLSNLDDPKNFEDTIDALKSLLSELAYTLKTMTTPIALQKIICCADTMTQDANGIIAAEIKYLEEFLENLETFNVKDEYDKLPDLIDKDNNSKELSVIIQQVSSRVTQYLSPLFFKSRELEIPHGLFRYGSIRKQSLINYIENYITNEIGQRKNLCVERLKILRKTTFEPCFNADRANFDALITTWECLYQLFLCKRENSEILTLLTMAADSYPKLKNNCYNWLDEKIKALAEKLKLEQIHMYPFYLKLNSYFEFHRKYQEISQRLYSALKMDSKIAPFDSSTDYETAKKFDEKERKDRIQEDEVLAKAMQEIEFFN